MHYFQFSLSRRHIQHSLWLIFLALCAGNFLALTLLHAAGIEDGWGLVTLLHFDREQNIPTLFAVLLLLASSVMALACSENAAETRVLRRGWVIVAVILALMALDEFVSIHERLDSAIRYYLGSESLPYVVWPIPYLIGIGLLGLRLAPWFFALKPRLALSLIIAGFIFIAGAAGVELVAGDYIEHIDPNREGISSWRRDLFATLEESLEFTGIILVLQILTAHAANDRQAGIPGVREFRPKELV